MTDKAVKVDEQALEQKFENISLNNKETSRLNKDGAHKHRLPIEERISQWEEERKAKRVLNTGLQGKVKWYSVLRRYGFIARNDGGKDVFVHQSAIAKSNTEKVYLRTLAEGEEVLFDLVEGRNGPEAANVAGPDGTNVAGSRYRHKLLSRFRNYRKPRRSVDGEKSEAINDKKLDEQIPAEGKKKSGRSVEREGHEAKNAIKPEEPSPQNEEKKKARKQRKNRNRKVKKTHEKGDGDTAGSTIVQQSALPEGFQDSKSRSKKATDKAELFIEEAALGAQPLDSQI